MSTWFSPPLGLLFAIIAAAFNPAQAASFCATSEGSFRTALNAAAVNGETNFIRVVAGNYSLGAALGYSSNATNSLFISGGYAPACSGQTSEPSVLDGQDVRRPLFIYAPNANVTVTGFDFVNGLSTNNRGGGLFISGKDVRVDLNRFIGNRADDYGGGLKVSSSGEMRVRNNAFLANTAAAIGAAELLCNGPFAAVTGNTVVANTSDTATYPGGVWIGGSAHFSVSNNILWNNTTNGAVDLNANTGHERIDNDIGTSNGTVEDASSAGNLSVNPQFAPCAGFLCFSFVLKRTSPLVDAGENAPQGAPALTDLLGGARIVGGRADIGAYELDVLFANGFGS
ncbi:MAG: choice-of-anchor Q domain-containing protein [Tahibacter sp.]